MKKTLKILLTILFVVVSFFLISNLASNYSIDGLFFTVIAFVFFLFALFVWIAPKTCFNLCWKFTRFLPDTYDYETGYSKLGVMTLGLLVTANIVLIIGFLMV
jgi:hypothetical protein